MNVLRREAEYFFGAIRFFTRLPVPAWVGHSPEALNHSARYFPLVGLVIGLIGALAFASTSFFLPKTLAVSLQPKRHAPRPTVAAFAQFTRSFFARSWEEIVETLPRPRRLSRPRSSTPLNRIDRRTRRLS